MVEEVPTRRAQRARLAAAVVATVAVAATAVAGTVAVLTARDATVSRAVPAASEVLTAAKTPPTRLIGFHDLGVKVPRHWVTERAGCSTAVRPRVWFASTEVWYCPNMRPPATRPRVAASIEIGPLALFPLPHGSLSADRSRGALMIERTPLTCHDRLCSQAYVVPASDVFFLISVPARNRQLVTSIRDTIAPLPEGSTAVPYTTAGADVGVVARAMRRADLAISEPVPQPGTQQMVLSTDPKPGTVLRRGSTVQLRVSSYTSWTSSSPDPQR